MPSARRPRISVITVTWNLIEAGRKSLFCEALDSIQAQNFRDMEHVILDGDSSDGTQDLISGQIREWEGKPDAIPFQFHSAPDAGLYDAMNKAVAMARGDYVIFLNSDDLIYAPDTFAKLMDATRDLNPDFIYGSTVRLLEDGGTTHLRRTSLKAVLQRMPFGHNSALIRRQTFLDLGGHILSYPLGADYDFVLRMVCSGATGLHVDTPVSLFRVGGLSADDDKVGRDYARVWRAFFADYLDMSAYSDEHLLSWYQGGTMPMRVLYAVLRTPGISRNLRAAALHSLNRSFRRSLQPWRKTPVGASR